MKHTSAAAVAAWLALLSIDSTPAQGLLPGERETSIAAIPGVGLVNDSFFNEFTLNLPVEARPAVHAMVEKGVLGGVSLGRLYPGVDALEKGLVVAVTETVTDEDIDALEAALKEVVQ